MGAEIWENKNINKWGYRNMSASNELLHNLDKLHTTELGVVRIKRNLPLDTDDVVGWCRDKINSDKAVITRNGKNWYIYIDVCIITVNAYSYTIITAHKKRWMIQLVNRTLFSVIGKTIEEDLKEDKETQIHDR